MKITNIILTSLAATYILCVLSACCSSDCVADADFIIEFFDAQTGEEININPTCEQDNPNRKAAIQIVDASQEIYDNYYCGNYISMTYKDDHSDLCKEPKLTFHVLYEEQIVETVTVTYINSSSCGCTPVCMGRETVTVEKGSEIENEIQINIRI